MSTRASSACGRIPAVWPDRDAQPRRRRTFGEEGAPPPGQRIPAADDLLAAEALYEPGEWAAIEDLAREFLDEPRSLAIDPREHAAARLVNLVATMNEAELDPEV
jgi:hypothetical protein